MGRITTAFVDRVSSHAAGSKRLLVLVADDDSDDWGFIADALADVGSNVVRFVRHGEELLDYLRRTGVHTGRSERENPDLLILDLKMPRMGGAEALAEIRADPLLQRLPVVVLTTSTSEDEVNFMYEMGANSVISKPSSYVGLVEILRGVRSYWADVVRLPTSTPRLEGALLRDLPAVNRVELPEPKRRVSWLKPSHHD